MNVTQFALGQKVISKRTGCPLTGLVISIMTPSYFCHLNGCSPSPYWTSLYPDWQTKSVVTVWTGRPVRHMNKEEFSSFAMSEACKENFPNGLAYEDLPFVNVVAYPEDDLEPFDDDQFTAG